MAEKECLNIIILGGNGYVGTALIERWSRKEPGAEFFAVSRSGKGKLTGPRIHYLKADAAKIHEVEAVLPEKCDYVVDCVGIYSKDEKALDAYNVQPAKVMLQIAGQRPVKALGYIGGALGPKAFVKSKTDAIRMLEESGQKIAYVEPALIFGNGRNDSMAKMVPLLKFFGLFSKKMKPVEVNQLADDLIHKLTQ